ncbi:proline iminopeptidase [Friedmanniella endophytica]|uniref:Proline iminopeptidase n=1 Tax=Microlunatus kandeliicorticis TaxID=1759536 RepID=A0A7W3IR59_9ACTN|nr:prolyl aminopeptidase [Microlunatus kandeliicorticis]MBA8793751.1 proline iminopeptidase [Microlunatus kandeliicorticis]
MPYPPIEPYATGMLDVGDQNAIFWECSGNPDGKPAVVLHGGPGSGLRPGPRKSFDPTRYRIVQYDQRGCGRSTPHASDPATDLGVNTTAHLVADLERLREHLGVDRWLVFGGSWGSTLALTYATRYPERVSELILIGVTTGRHSEIDWLYRGVRRFFPEAWERFRDAVPEELRGDGLDAFGLLRGYTRLMDDPDREVRARAAAAWCAWEDAVLSTEEYGSPTAYSDRIGDDRLAFVRICAHYFSHRVFLPDDVIFDRADRLAGIPGVMLHGRADLSGPAVNAWELSRLWPDAELTVFGGAGHKGNEAMGAALLAATDRFR